MTWKQILPEIDQTITADSVGGLIMAFILYVVVCFGMFGTVLMMTEERKYEFGVLISIGMSRMRLFGIILVETIILSKQMLLSKAFRTAIGMSLISMISMEVAMNAVDWIILGEAKLVWWVIPIMLFVGFLTPWPYNYYRLKKYNIACH